MVKKWKFNITLPLSMLLLMVNGVNSAEIGFSPESINMESWAPYYRPFEATVLSHTPIQWKNPTASPHSVRHDGCTEKNGPCLFNSGAVPPNGSYQISGLAPGRYPYHCELHPIMRGELIISGTPFESRKELEQVAQHNQTTQ